MTIIPYLFRQNFKNDIISYSFKFYLTKTSHTNKVC